MDRYWLLTWTTYGSWLPGDPRGFVSNVADETGQGVRHNTRGEPCDADLPALHDWMETQLKGPVVLLNRDQAIALLAQFQETARHRGWLLRAAAVMRNHAHLLVGVSGDPEPDTLLRDFKSYASRALNRRWGRPASGTWWTESGSKRKKAGEEAVRDAVGYVRDQPYALVVWVAEEEASGGRQPPVESLEQGADAPRSPISERRKK
jgi:REP element-mobilizing transposase RayT